MFTGISSYHILIFLKNIEKLMFIKKLLIYSGKHFRVNSWLMYLDINYYHEFLFKLLDNSTQ